MVEVYQPFTDELFISIIRVLNPDNIDKVGVRNVGWFEPTGVAVGQQQYLTCTCQTARCIDTGDWNVNLDICENLKLSLLCLVFCFSIYLRFLKKKPSGKFRDSLLK